MRTESKRFLETLIKTYSPSGDEGNIQKVWMDYLKPYAHELKKDMTGNAIAVLNPDAPFKVLLTGHIDEIAFMVTHIDEKGYLYVTAAGGISPKLALGMRVNVLGYGGVLKGVVGVQAEHRGGAKDEIKLESLYIDVGACSKEELESQVRPGDYILYDLDFDYLMNNRLTGRGLDNRTGAFIVAEVLRILSEKDIQVGVYSAATVNEETNMGGAYFAAAKIKPQMAIACDVTFATDDIGSNPKKDGDVKLGSGPVLAVGSMVNKKINALLEEAAKSLDMKPQIEITPRRTGTDADMMRFTGEGVPVALVSLPLRYMHSPSEVVSLEDIEAEIHLIVKMIESLTGEENLMP